MSRSIEGSELPRLGSLAQSAREKELRNAKRILIVIGLLTIAFNAFLLFNAGSEAHQVVTQEVQKLGPGQVADPIAVKTAESRIWLFCVTVYGTVLALGVLFAVFGVFIKKFPVPITVISLVLYVLVNVGLMALNPALMWHGLIVKIIIVVALAKAIQSAIAYEKERGTQLEMEPGYE